MQRSRPGRDSEKARFAISGQTILATAMGSIRSRSRPPYHSLSSANQKQEIDRLYAALSEGVSALLPINSFGFSRKFAWVNDHFAVSWQLNLS